MRLAPQAPGLLCALVRLEPFKTMGVACSSREDKGKVDVDSDVPIKASEFSDIGAGNVVGKGGRGVQVEGKDVGGLR